MSAGTEYPRRTARALGILRALASADARGVTRDSLLRWILVLMPLMALLLRFGVPLVTDALERALGFDLRPYYALVMSFVGVIGAQLVGTVVGFLLLDQRDDLTLSALLVTPMRLGEYLAYRLALPMVIAVPMTIAMFPIAGLTDLSVAQVLVTSICAAPLAALYALFVGSFAANKVQGFALCKGAGILSLPVIIAWFLPVPWQHLVGLIPLYWPVKVFWLFDDGEAARAVVYAAVGLAYQAVLLVVLMRRFATVVRR